MIRILHLTDFHLNTKTLTDWNDFYKDAFFLKLDELQQEKPIELVAFTGDLIDKGGISFIDKGDVLSPATKGFAIFKESIIEPILKKLNLDISQFIICPGNHDINRFADDEADEIGQKATLTTTEKITDFIKRSDDSNSFKRIERIKEYKNFEQDLYKDMHGNKIHSLFKFSVRADINGKTIGITSLNSSWRCYNDSDFGNILIGEKQLNDNYKFIEDCDIKIGLAHHQTDWLSSIEQKTIKSHMANNFDLLLSGHVHSSNTEHLQSVSGSCVYSISPSGLNQIRENNVENLNGFTLIDYDSEKVEFHYLNYNHILKIFVDNTNVADKGKQIIKLADISNGIYGKNSQGVEIDIDFLEFLNDSGANFTHRSKETLLLNDIYVYPFLEKFSLSDQEDKTTSIKSDNILEKIINDEIKNTVFLGEENSGKTSLCKTLFTRLINNKDVLPVYIKGRNIKKALPSDIENLINKEIRKQYESLTDHSNFRKVLIVDDFNSCGMTPKSKRFFLNNLFSSEHQTVIIWDEFFTLSELLESQAINIDIYEILKFGARKRYELICKWVSLFSEDFENEIEKASQIKELEKTINSVIGKNLVPSQAIYILTILQASEISNNQNFEQSTFGHYYDVLIKSALGQKIKDNKEIEKYYSYLSELSFWVYNLGIIEFEESKFIEYHNYFKNEYKISTGFVETVRILEECSIIAKTNGLYKFKYKYIYFYFVGKFLSDNIEKESIKDTVKLLSDKLYQTDTANIYIFLSHHSKSKFVINQILEKAKILFDEQPLLGFNEDIKQINDLIEGVTENLGFDNSKDASDFIIDESEVVEDDDKFEDGKDSIDSISKVNKAFKTIEILGYIIKNRYASLRGSEKEELIDELYKLGLRTLSFLFKTLLEGEEFIKSEIIELIKKDTTSNLTAGEREGLAKQYMFNLLYMISYSIFKKLSTSISSKDLEITFQDIKNSYPSNNAIQLIDIAVVFEYSKNFPFKETDLLVDKFKSNKLSYFILRRLGVNFMRMMPMKEVEQQKAGELLDISMKSQRLIGGSSKITK
jgi:predicted phosphodiesterase